MVTLIGSRPGCKVNLRHKSISAVQTAIVNTGSELVAIDLLTKNPTKLNGLKMEHETLTDGDQLTIGPWKFSIEINMPDHHNNGADLHHLKLDHSPHVVAFEHLRSGRILQSNRDICIIGRRSGCDIHLDDDKVSRIHALLFSCHDHPAICDLMSRNQTFVNDEPVSYHVLENDDIVKIGDSEFRVRLLDSNVNHKASKKSKFPKPEISLESEDHIDDLIDIQEVEGANPWRIVDKLEQAS